MKRKKASLKYSSPHWIKYKPRWVSWLSLSPYPSPLFISSCRSFKWTKCPHRTDVCKSWLVGHQLHVSVLESIRERCLWVGPFLPSSSQYFLFVLLGYFVRLEVNGCTTAALWYVASRICSKEHVEFWCSPYLTVSPKGTSQQL